MTDIGPTAGAGPTTPASLHDFRKARERSEATRRAEPTDRSGFTDEARELARARGAVNEAPEVRAAKIEELKAKIASGEYVPDPRAIAEKILERGI